MTPKIRLENITLPLKICWQKTSGLVKYMKNFSKHIHPLRRAIVMISVQFCGLVDSPHSEPQSQTCSQIPISSEQYLHKPVTCATNDNKAQIQGASHWFRTDVIFRPNTYTFCYIFT